MSLKPASIKSILCALFANLSITMAKSGTAFWTGSGATREFISRLADCEMAVFRTDNRNK